MKLQRRGLSMIELVLVLLVIGLMAAVATPRFSDSLRVTQLESAAQQLAAHIDYLRAVAMNEGRTVDLICDNSDSTYQSDSVDFPERIGDRLLVSLPRDYDPTFSLRANFDSSTTLSFDLEGVPHVGAIPLTRGRITLRSGNDRFRVTIASGTGTTTVTRIDRNVTETDGTLDDATAEVNP
jgi:prepilin-type N-terminal cleavage/methylation domain-containing protein